MIKFQQLRERLRGSLWFVPALFVAGAVGLAIGMTKLDAALGDRADVALAFTGGPESARQILSTIASSMITFTGLVFSITIVVLQLASAQFSPRVLRTFLRDRLSQIALGVFVATFAYALAVLRVVRADESAVEGFVPGLAISLAFLLVLASLGVFVRYIDHIAQSIRAVSIISGVSRETRSLIERRYTEDIEPDPGTDVPTGAPDHVVRYEGRPGTVVDVNLRRLVRLAHHEDSVLVLRPMVGDFVPTGAALFHVYGDLPDPKDLRAAVGVSAERTMQQDVTFGFRQLVDIACRALSTGVNDPTTAVQVLDQLHDLLRRLAGRPFPSGLHRDEDGHLRLVVPTTSWEDYVTLAMDEIRLYGESSLQVMRRLRSMLDDLANVTPPERRGVVREKLQLLESGVERAFDDASDRERARKADGQGLGS